MSEYTKNLTARQLISYIANDYVELSHDKVLWQRDDFIKICREWLQNNPEEFADEHPLAIADDRQMSKIVLSCGHQVDDMYHGYTIFTKTTDREGNKAVAYQTVCGPCEDRYRQHGEILDSEEAADVWLEKEEW